MRTCIAIEATSSSSRRPSTSHVRTAAPGTKNAQGIDQETASRTAACSTSTSTRASWASTSRSSTATRARAYAPAPTSSRSRGSPCGRTTSSIRASLQPGSALLPGLRRSLAAVGVPLGSIDSLRISLTILIAGLALRRDEPGQHARNLLRQLPPRPSSAAAQRRRCRRRSGTSSRTSSRSTRASPPGDNAAFDTTTALMTHRAQHRLAGRTIRASSPAIRSSSSPRSAGDGVTTGARARPRLPHRSGPGQLHGQGQPRLGARQPRPGASVLRHVPGEQRAVRHARAATAARGTGTSGTRRAWTRRSCGSTRSSRAASGTRSPARGWARCTSPTRTTRRSGSTHTCASWSTRTASTDESNITCSGTPPAIYGAVSGTSKEARRSCPTAGSRRARTSSTSCAARRSRRPGRTNSCSTRRACSRRTRAATADHDQERWSSVDVLPDLWKSTRFGGAGLACLLMVDGADRRGADPPYRGAADSLGYGKDNGATSGWRALGAGHGSERPGRVRRGEPAASTASTTTTTTSAPRSRSEAGHPGMRFAQNLGGDRAEGRPLGPSAAHARQRSTRP